MGEFQVTGPLTEKKKLKSLLGARVGPSLSTVGNGNLVRQGGGDEGEHKSSNGKHKGRRRRDSRGEWREKKGI